MVCRLYGAHRTETCCDAQVASDTNRHSRFGAPGTPWGTDDSLAVVLGETWAVRLQHIAGDRNRPGKRARACSH